MSAPATTMQVKVRWSVSLAAESSRLEFAAMLTRPLYSSVGLIETFWFFCLTSRSPGSPSPLSWRAEHGALVTRLSHMALASSSNGSTQRSCATSSVYAVSYGGTDACSNGQPMHSDWAWFRHDKWVSDRFHHFECIDLCCDLHISIWWSGCLLLLWLHCCTGSPMFPHTGRKQCPDRWLRKTKAGALLSITFQRG